MINFSAGSPLMARQDPILLIIVITALSLITITILIRFILLKFKEKHLTLNELEKIKSKKTTFNDIKRISSLYNLSKEEQSLLWFICKKTEAPNIFYSARSKEHLLDIFKQSYQILKNTNYSDRKISLLFDLLFKIEKKNAEGRKIVNSLVLPLRTILIYHSSEKKPSSLEIYKTTPDFIIAKAFDVFLDSKKRPPALSKINLTFVFNTDIQYIMQCRIVRYQINFNGIQEVVLTHSLKISPLLRRNAKRKTVDIPCKLSIIRVTISSDNSKKNISYEVQPTKYESLITNISKTGCLIETSVETEKGKLIQMEFKFPGTTKTVSAYAMIISTRINPLNKKILLHSSFTKINVTLQNKILAFIYNFD